MMSIRINFGPLLHQSANLPWMVAVWVSCSRLDQAATFFHTCLEKLQSITTYSADLFSTLHWFNPLVFVKSTVNLTILESHATTSNGTIYAATFPGSHPDSKNLAVWSSPRVTKVVALKRARSNGTVLPAQGLSRSVYSDHQRKILTYEI